jgi:hypothetical protein
MPQNSTQWRLAVGAGIGATLLTAYAIQHWRKVHNYWNSEFKEVGRVDHLFVYPVKSCRGVEANFIIF